MIETITSVQNPLIKRIVNLKQKKYRDKENLFIAEGVRLAEDALKSLTNIKYCFYTKNSLENKRIMAIIERLKTEPIKLIEVSLSVYEKITETNEPQGIMVILQHNNYNLKEFAKLEKPFLIILDTIQDPGNIGTIIRTAEASGCNGVILTKGCADILASSYRNSYFNAKDYKLKHDTLLATCRAGNVIGGGDWAKDRLITKFREKK